MAASRCTLDAAHGPISAGPVAFTAVNETHAQAAFHMFRIADGHTCEQLAAYVGRERQRTKAGEPGLGPPPWVEGPIQLDLGSNESGTLLGMVRSGTHGIVCTREFQQPGELHAFATVGPVEVE